MKRSKLLFIIAIIAMMTVLFAACDDTTTENEHTHTFGAWVITAEPTETTTGEAKRECLCGKADTVTVAKLTDASIWNIETSQDPTHTSKGFIIYKSVYGTLTVIVEKGEHVYGAWTISVEPTMTKTGRALKQCACGSREEVTLPALTDNIWKKADKQSQTHTQDGIKEYTSEYGVVTVVTAKAGHSYGDWIITTEPTTDAEGSAERICPCGDKDVAVVENLSDRLVWTIVVNKEVVEHESEGVIVYASKYGTVTKTVEKGTHIFGNFVFVTEPTETTAGVAAKYCACGKSVRENVPLLADESVWTRNVEQELTDEKDGIVTYTSAKYGKITVTTTTTGHKFGGWTITKAPTETQEGSATRKCLNSDCEKSEDVTVACLADEAVWKKTIDRAKVLHESDGIKVYQSVYGIVEIKDNAGKHSYGKWKIVVNPTQTQTGFAKHICDCGKEEAIEIAPLQDENIWNKTERAATHVDDGEIKYESEYGIVVIFVPRISHEFNREIVEDRYKVSAADCTQPARYRFSCVCGESGEETFDVGEPNGHTLGELEIESEATCAENGIRVQKCENCPYANRVVIDAFGHKFGAFEIVKEATCTQTGTAEATCLVCGEREENVLAAKGHRLGNAYVALVSNVKTLHSHKCEYCDYIDDENAQAHGFADEYIVCESGADGKHIMKSEHACEVCGYKEKTRDLGALEDWTESESKQPDYNEKGYIVYTKDGFNYRLYIDKLVAPYDNKEYRVVKIGFPNGANIEKADIVASDSDVIVIDENGIITSLGTSFGKTNKIEMSEANSTVGKIVFASDNEVYAGYVDMTTGIIVMSKENDSASDVIVLYCNEVIAVNGIAACGWSGVSALSFNCDCPIASHVYNVFIDEDGTATFGVDFKNKDNMPIKADDCVDCDYLKVEKSDVKLVAFAKNKDGIFVRTDGLEGQYTDAVFGIAEINGIGDIQIGEDIGVYEKSTTGDFYKAFVKEEDKIISYYAFVVSDGRIYVEKPMTAIEYASQYAESTIGNEFKERNDNVEFALPVFDDTDDLAFMGWKLNGEGEYVKRFTPTGESVTFVAEWKKKIVVTIVDSFTGNRTSVRVLEGSVVFDYLPKYTSKDNLLFVDWFIADKNGDGKYDIENDEVFDRQTIADDSQEITVIAGWKEIVYSGEYVGTKVEANDCGNQSQSLAIDVFGNVTGYYGNGKVQAFDEASQTLTIEFEGETYFFVFDSNTKLLLGGCDLSDCTQESSVEKLIVWGVSQITSTIALNFNQTTLRFVDFENTDVLLYNNRIHAEISITDVSDKSLTTALLKESKSVIVKDSDGKIIFSGATKGVNFEEDNTIVEFDDWAGTYTDTVGNKISLDGAGTITVHNSSGVLLGSGIYEVADDFVIAIFESETQKITINKEDGTYSSESYIVTITYLVDGREVYSDTVYYGKESTLWGEYVNESYDVEGWYVQGDETQTLLNGKFIVRGDMVLVAKLIAKQ